MIPAAHLNETLKRTLPVMANTNATRLAHVLQTPYLTFKDHDHKGITGDEMRAAGLIDDFGLPRTPFPVFRFCMEDYKRRIIFGCVQRDEGKIQLVAFHRYEGKLGPVGWAIIFKRWERDGDLEFDGRMFDTRTLHDVTDIVKKSEELREPPPSMDGMTREKARSLIPKLVADIERRELAIDVLRGQADMLESSALIASANTPSTFIALFHSLMVLSYEYLAPHNFVARVIPSTQGKSVEWLRAREHFTVIHRHHAANNRDVKEGATVSNDGHATRLAHSRRAHTRMLTHPKWTFKRGQRVFVRASWVGPKEWKDTAGQTYQILTPAM